MKKCFLFCVYSWNAFSGVNFRWIDGYSIVARGYVMSRERWPWATRPCTDRHFQEFEERPFWSSADIAAENINIM
jgi:hypothetical protein